MEEERLSELQHRTPTRTLPSARSIDRCSSSESNLRRSLSPTFIRDRIKMQRTDNLWHIMHAGDVDEHTPKFSVPRLRLVRPATSSISSLTARENVRLEQRINQVGPTRAIGPVQTTRTVSNSVIPLDEDFKRVLEKLNRITTKGGLDESRLILHEKKTTNVNIDGDKWAHASVRVLGMQTPLELTIKKTKGRIVTYVSKTIPEPMDLLCDAKFNGDRILITDSGLRFKVKSVFFGFHALEDSSFSLHLRFGMRKHHAHTLPKEEEVVDDKESDWLKSFNRPAVKPPPDKDYILMNMRVSASAERLGKMSERRAMSEKRRRDAAQKYRLQLDLRRSQALSQLHRQEDKRQIRLQEAKLQEAKATREQMERQWLFFVPMIQVLETLSLKLRTKKAELAEAKRKEIFLEKVQKKIRVHLSHNSPKVIALLVCIRHMQLLVGVSSPIYTKRVPEIIFSSIQNSHHNVKVPTLFGIFYHRSKLYIVRRLQVAWKTAILNKKNRFERLNSIWSQAFTRILEAVSKRKQTKRGKRSKENPTAVYFAISPLRKTQVLMQHYLESKETFLIELRGFLLSRRAGAAIPPPSFGYIPDMDTMMRLIEKAATSDL